MVPKDGDSAYLLDMFLVCNHHLHDAANLKTSCRRPPIPFNPVEQLPSDRICSYDSFLMIGNLSDRDILGRENFLIQYFCDLMEQLESFLCASSSSF